MSLIEEFCIHSLSSVIVILFE